MDQQYKVGQRVRHKATGQLFEYDGRGWRSLGVVPQGAKARPDYGAGAYEVDGQILTQGENGAPKVLTKPAEIRDFEANAAARAQLMDAGLQNYQEAVRQGYDPSAFRNQIASGLEGVWGVGPWAADVIRDNAGELGRSAEIQFTDGALRTTTGANAPEPEVRRASRAYFRQPGESPAVEPSRANLRERFRDQAIKVAGRAYVPPRKSDRAPPPKAAAARYMEDLNAGRIDRSLPYGDARNPYIARSREQAERLPSGSYVFLPDGSLARVP